MRTRKINEALEYLVLAISVWVLISIRENMWLILAGMFSFLFLADCLFFFYEYLRFIRPKKSFLIEIKNRYNIITLLKIACYVVFFVVYFIYITDDSLNTRSTWTSSLFFIIIGTRQLFFQKYFSSVRIDHDRLLFGELRSEDIWLIDINKATLGADKKIITLELKNLERRTIGIDPDFYEKNNFQIEKIVEFINAVAGQKPSVFSVEK